MSPQLPCVWDDVVVRYPSPIGPTCVSKLNESTIFFAVVPVFFVFNVIIGVPSIYFVCVCKR